MPFGLSLSMRYRSKVSRGRLAASMAVLAVVLWLLFLIQNKDVGYFMVTSESMQPALEVGDRLIMVKAERLRVGDLIVFPDPKDPGVLLIKRLVAIGPARVSQADGELFIDGERNDPPQGRLFSYDIPDRQWQLDPDQVFAVGDNRPSSLDSRDFGPVERWRIRGIARYRLAPAERRGWFP